MSTWRVNTWNIHRGGDCQLCVHLLDSVNTLPINIAGASVIKLLLKNSDGSVLMVQADQGLAVGLGQQIFIYSFPLTAAQTALLPLQTAAPVEVEVFWGDRIQKYLLSSSLTTFDPAI
jgi:hypothetical protein